MTQRLFTLFLMGPLLLSGFLSFACCGGESDSCCCRPPTPEATCPCSKMPADSSSSDDCRCAAKTKPWLTNRMQIDERPQLRAQAVQVVTLTSAVGTHAELQDLTIDHYGGSTAQQVFCLWLE